MFDIIFRNWKTFHSANHLVMSTEHGDGVQHLFSVLDDLLGRPWDNRRALYNSTVREARTELPIRSAKRIGYTGVSPVRVSHRGDVLVNGVGMANKLDVLKWFRGNPPSKNHRVFYSRDTGVKSFCWGNKLHIHWTIEPDDRPHGSMNKHSSFPNWLVLVQRIP